ncbi:peroxiredoxin family protein [Flavobacterium facile]|uniref:peroxiredoxin family protein n=1 Tax=Flavobacterium facile TaxID=2893174 RepID=UPI002E78A67D|nr:TlpA disulfide reductase family protein [Flavobacterium sp. T-12]
MNRLIFFLFLFSSYNCLSQEYNFIPKEFKETKREAFLKTATSDTLRLVKMFLENGIEFNKQIKDSLETNKLLGFYSKKYFLSENKKQFYIVYKKLSTKEKKQLEVSRKNEITNDRKKYKSQHETVLEKLNFKDIAENNFTLDSLKGKVIVLNFWFIGCKPCVEEIPDLNKIHEKFKDKDVAFFAITFDSKKKLEEFGKKKQFNFTLVPNSRDVIRQFYVNAYPTTIIIDKERKIHLVDDLLVFDLMNKIEKMINEYLK